MSQLTLEVKSVYPISDKLKEQLGTWTCLYPFFESQAWQTIKTQLAPDIDTITPDVSVWFRAFKETPFDSVRVVWLGMSPYFTLDPHTKKKVADGLAFSTDIKHAVPPSLFKLYKGMEWDLWGGMNLCMERRNDLTFLARQGVLLLNSSLTTVLGDPKKHLDIWKPFILYFIKTMNEKKNGLIFTGFGTHANQLLSKVDRNNHYVKEREHPAASAYVSRDWDHQHLFSITNELLSLDKHGTILWDNYLVEQDVPF